MCYYQRCASFIPALKPFSANIEPLTKKNEVVFPKPLSSFIYIMYQLFASCYILFITSFYASQLSIQTILCSSLFHFHLFCEYRLDYNIKIEFLLSVKSNDSEYYTFCVGGEERLVEDRTDESIVD